MTPEQHGKQWRLELAVIGAARRFVHEQKKERPTKELLAMRVKLELAVTELEAHEQACTVATVRRHG